MGGDESVELEVYGRKGREEDGCHTVESSYESYSGGGKGDDGLREMFEDGMPPEFVGVLILESVIVSLEGEGSCDSSCVVWFESCDEVIEESSEVVGGFAEEVVHGGREPEEGELMGEFVEFDGLTVYEEDTFLSLEAGGDSG